MSLETSRQIRAIVREEIQAFLREKPTTLPAWGNEVALATPAVFASDPENGRAIRRAPCDGTTGTSPES